MPARRRAQEAKRAERRAVQQATLNAQRSMYVEPVDIDREWADHQAWERQRRADLADPIRAARLEEERQARRQRMWAEIIRARDGVLADFARWRTGDFS